MSKQAPSKLKFASHFIVLTALTSMVAQTVVLPSRALQTGIRAGLRMGLTTSQAAPDNAGSGQRTNSKIISFLLASSRETNPEKALALLSQAREELKKEGLAPEDANRILAMIDNLERKLRARLGQAAKPPEQKIEQKTLLGAGMPIVASLDAVAGTKSNNSPTKEGMSTKDVETTLAENPEMRDALWEIGRSRLSRDARNLDGVVQQRTGKTPEEIDAEEAKARAEAYQIGFFSNLLVQTGLWKADFTEVNRQLRQEFEGVSTDELADYLIQNALLYSAGAGALKGVINEYGARGLGVGAEVLTTFILNSRLVLRLANLYGVELADVEKEIFLFSVFVAAKAGAQYGKDGSMAEMFKKLGQRLGDLKFKGMGTAFVDMLKGLLKSKNVAKHITPEMQQVMGPATAPSATGGSAANSATASAPSAPQTRMAKLKSIATRFKLMALVQTGYFAALSTAETAAIGFSAKYILTGMHDSKREIHNENFRRFLMTPTAEGFFKLMTLASIDGLPSAPRSGDASQVAISKEAKAKMTFIVNIARSARLCSPEDIKKMQTDKTASYACFGNINTDRFERLRAEMLTFDEIPQDYIADLRAVSRQNRLRMAELILQMQFLDGDRSPSETQFFRGVVAKALGVDTIEDLRYFERLHAYIQENGGMEVSLQTPTGFTIRSKTPAGPYDMNRGYLPVNAPEAPLDPRPVTASAITPPAPPAPKPAEPAK